MQEGKAKTPTPRELSQAPFFIQKETSMNVNTLFGPGKPKPIRFKTIKAVYETLTIREDISGYISTGNRYTAPSQVFDTFRFLQRETKEYFIALHLDGKNRILCIDMVSVGSLNQSIVHPRETLKIVSSALQRQSSLYIIILPVTPRRHRKISPSQSDWQRPAISLESRYWIISSSEKHT